MSPSLLSLSSLSPHLCPNLFFSSFPFLLPQGSEVQTNHLLVWSNPRTILHSCHLGIPGSKCFLWFWKRLMKNLQRAGELLLARRCCSSVLAPVGCVGEVLGWHCGSEPVLDLPACDTGKSLKSTTFWCSNLSGLIPGLHVMAGQLPFGGKTPSASPAEGPIRDIPGGYSLRGLNNPACPSSVLLHESA